MNLSSRGRYAVTAMLDLALHRGGEVIVPLSDISLRQGISLAYLEQLFSKLRRASLVTSTRGPGGGYSLARKPADISIADIVDAVDEITDAAHCNGSESCDDGHLCLGHRLWTGLDREIRKYLSGTSLSMLIERDEIRKVAERQDRNWARINDRR